MDRRVRLMRDLAEAERELDAATTLYAADRCG
jgi:hypothetical protein